MNLQLCLAVVAAVCIVTPAAAVKPSADEIALCHRFVSARIDGLQEPRELHTGLTVLLADNANIGFQRNGRDGQPLRIGGKEFTKGLFSHANARFRVSLPSPGKSFTCVAGIDSNQLKGTGSGSVVFSVQVEGKDAFRSNVIREGMPGAQVNADLAGATEFVIDANDAGDGIGYDHAAWADAKITLADGSELWLGDLPFLGQWGLIYSTDPPVSFVYDGKPSAELLKSWGVKRDKSKLDDNRTQFTVTWTDPKTGLELRCTGIEYRDFPTVEWTAYLKNTGSSDTPIIENIQALDMSFEPGPEGKLTLNHNAGGMSGPGDFEPLTTPLEKDVDKRFIPWDGFPTATDLPYFNIERPGGGVIIGLGWPARWAAEFTRKAQPGLRVLAGQEYTHLKLHPGEEIRTPLVALQFWTGDDRVRSQNIWRRWMIAHNVPRPGGKLPRSIFAGQGPALDTNNAELDKRTIDKFLEEKLQPDVFWIDAGWYPKKTGDWQDLLGTWQVDKTRYPDELKGIADYMHARGMKLMVWFEPERVQPDSWLYVNHPEWLLGPVGTTRLFNYGNPEARKWMTDYIGKFIHDQGIDIYRQDFASFPMEKWKAADTDDRRGISENRYVVGYLAYLDGIFQQNPGLMMDICAAGGKRLDLEHLRRAVPMWRSDLVFDPTGMQSQTYGISYWIPYFGTALSPTDAYAFRSNMCPSNVTCCDAYDKKLDYALLRRMVSEWKQVADNYYGDYYPLTPYSRDDHEWMGWQFDRPEAGEGFIQVFRREKSFYVTACFQLKGLDPNARYRLDDFDTKKPTEMTGKELMEKGLTLTLTDKPGSALIKYRRMQ